MKRYTYVKAASESQKTEDFRTYRYFVSEVLRLGYQETGSDYLRGKGSCPDPNDLDQQIEYSYNFDSVEDITSLAKELLPVYSKYIQKVLSIADKYNASSNVSNSSQKQTLPDSVLIDDNFISRLIDALFSAGISGEDADLATNNLYIDHKDSYMDRYDLTEELISNLFGAAKGSGLGRDELADAYEYFSDNVPDAVDSVVGL